MNTETTEPAGVADMIRTTAANQLNFLTQIADHIDKLEQSVVQLQHRITELENKPNESK